uniref:Uncharacterized protein n=1 Tax=uncultured marine virus TaxID=186617 RepID=A0A0F7L434_9VIRU|nr:hypothetical protein [uncultured marine virus]
MSASRRRWKAHASPLRSLKEVSHHIKDAPGRCTRDRRRDRSVRCGGYPDIDPFGVLTPRRL